MKVLSAVEPAQWSPLVPLATAEGLGYLERLTQEWVDGTNRFDKPGEILCLIQIHERTVACGGVTRQSESCARLRRVYVDPLYRRIGLGRTLVESLIVHARLHFGEIVLYTDNPEAGRLYERLGFVSESPTDTPEYATHRLPLT